MSQDYTGLPWRHHADVIHHGSVSRNDALLVDAKAVKAGHEGDRYNFYKAQFGA